MKKKKTALLNLLHFVDLEELTMLQTQFTFYPTVNHHLSQAKLSKFLAEQPFLVKKIDLLNKSISCISMDMLLFKFD